MPDVNIGTGRDRLLPDGSEISRLRNLPRAERPTLQEIGARYGVSRQAVHKALVKWNRQQATNDLQTAVTR